MADVKTITAREIKQITNAICEKPRTILWHGKRINVNPLLTFKEFVSLANEIVNRCIGGTQNVMVIESVDFVFKATILNKYAGIVLPNDLEDQYKIIYGTDLFSIVSEYINPLQLQNLKDIIYCYTGLLIH